MGTFDEKLMLCEAVERCDLAMVQLLLDAGIRVRVSDLTPRADRFHWIEWAMSITWTWPAIPLIVSYFHEIPFFQQAWIPPVRFLLIVPWLIITESLGYLSFTLRVKPHTTLLDYGTGNTSATLGTIPKLSPPIVIAHRLGPKGLPVLSELIRCDPVTEKLQWLMLSGLVALSVFFCLGGISVMDFRLLMMGVCGILCFIILPRAAVSRRAFLPINNILSRPRTRVTLILSWPVWLLYGAVLSLARFQDYFVGGGPLGPGIKYE